MDEMKEKNDHILTDREIEKSTAESMPDWTSSRRTGSPRSSLLCSPLWEPASVSCPDA